MFEGFRPETIDFLWGLRLNNQREWFLEHKTAYQQYLYEPLKALGAEVFAAFEDVPNMACKVSRIYKDARLHPAVPYKESLWLSMRPDNLPWSEQPTLYFEIRPEGYSFGFVLWHPKAESMERYRTMISSRPDEFLKLVRKTEKESGLKLTGQSFHKKYIPDDDRLKPYYGLKNVEFCMERSPDRQLFSSELTQEVIRTLKALYPFYEYCLKFTT